MSEPSLFTQAVEVSVRSESASTLLPDNRAATFADGMSAAETGPLAVSLVAVCCIFSRVNATAWPVLATTSAVSAASTMAVRTAIRGNSRLCLCRATAEPSHSPVGRVLFVTFSHLSLVWT
ncbi:hypothetical protein [Streptomyces sp. SID2888]|uniref:hypothetical protein n=1 Tax=Streptomyces sp. SID2888 TaxID=2690256 RepID=UPI0031F6F778